MILSPFYSTMFNLICLTLKKPSFLVMMLIIKLILEQQEKLLIQKL
ncbi:hypothetical protein pb186bvf_011842 [Paramecium bursaria]